MRVAVPARRSLPLLCLAAALCACGPGEPRDGKVHIRYLADPDVGGYARTIIERFEKGNPGVKVDMVEGPASTDARQNMYSTSFMAEEDTYDLAYIDVAWLPQFAAQGWLRPIDDRFTPALRAAFLPGDIEASRFEGKLYRVPFQSDAGVLYYRKDLLDAHGLAAPRTWDELVAAARRVRTAAVSGFVFQGKQYEGLVCVYLELLWGFGGELIDSEGRVRIDEKPAVDALEALVAAVHRDKIAPEAVLTYQEEEARNVFQEGRAAFMRNWPYAWKLMQAPGSAVRGKFAVAPMVAGPGGRPAATLGGSGFAISAYSRHPDEAWKLAEFFASPESQKTAFLEGGILPANKALYSDQDVLKAAPHMKDLYKVLSVARPRPMHPRWPRISDCLQRHLSAALSLQEEPAASLRAAAAEIRSVVARQ